MSQRKPIKGNKRRAIQAALGQLGWHASHRDIMAFLGNLGIHVNSDLVRAVKAEKLKSPGPVKRYEETRKLNDRRQKRPMLRKIPQRREYRS